MTGYEYATATKAGLGAPFAPTVPLIGVVEPYDGTVIVADSPEASTCSFLDAAVQVHGEFFKGPGGQQETQRQFLKNATTLLCANPDQSEDEYLQILHGMLATVRTAINRHVQSAFWVKIGCAHTVDLEVVDDLCVTTVLQHEGYNLVEGYYVVEMTYGLILRGAGFCTDPERDELLRGWSEELEAKMAHHRGNVAFEVLSETVREKHCPTSFEGQDGYEEYASARNLSTLNLRCMMTKPNEEKICTFPEPDAMQMLHSDPPDIHDGIDMVEQNTVVALGLAAEHARKVLVSEGCVDESGVDLAPEADRVAQLVAQIDASGLLSPPYARSGGRVAFQIADVNGAGEFEEGSTFPVDKTGKDVLEVLSLASVYHKLLASCVINAGHITWDDEGNMLSEPVGAMPFMCEGEDLGLEATHIHGSTGEDNPVFDIATATDIAQCSGEACRAAARAVVRYQSMLGPVTKMRWDVIQVVFGSVPAMPVMQKTSWVKQRSCAAFSSILSNAATVQAELPGVVADLRASANELTLTCVAPARNFNECGACLGLGGGRG